MSRRNLIWTGVALLVTTASVAAIALLPRTEPSGAKILVEPLPEKEKPKSFGSFYEPLAASDQEALAKLRLYWLGPKLGPLVAFIRHEQGANDRGVVIYAPAGKPDQPVVMIATLPSSGPLGLGGRDLLQQSKKAPRHSVIAGYRVAWMSPMRAVFQPVDDTVVDLVRLYPLAGVPEPRALVEQVELLDQIQR